MESPLFFVRPLAHRTKVNTTRSSPSSADTIVRVPPPPKTPRLPHASLFTGHEAVKTDISSLALSPPPTTPDTSVAESELPDIQSLCISRPIVPEQPQDEPADRYSPAPWSCIIYVVPGGKQSDEACSELEETWGPIAADLGAQLEFASQPAENPSLISDQSIADQANNLLALIKRRDNSLTEERSGSPSVEIAPAPLILAGYGMGGIVIKLMILSILKLASEADLGILERISLLVLVETPHRTLDLEDWRRVAKRLFPETPMNKRNRRIGRALERAARLAECTPGIFQLASGIGRGHDNAPWAHYTFTVGLSSRREVVFDHDSSDIIPFITRAMQNPKRPDPGLLRFLQELLTHFDLDNVYWKPPNSAETSVWLSTHPEYAAWIDAWSKNSEPNGALFLQHDRPSSRRRLTDLVHHLERELSATRPRSIVARFSFAEQNVKDKHVEAVLAAFAFQILCLQPARFNSIRHMVQGPLLAPDESLSARLETILKEIVAGTSKDPAELTLMVDGLELVPEDGRPLMETLMEIQASAAVGLLFTQLVHPSRRHPKGEVVVTNFDFLECPTQSRTGQRADLFSISRFKPSKRQQSRGSQQATFRHTDPLELRRKRSLLRSSCDSTTNSKDSILQLIPSSRSRPSKRRLGFQRSDAPSPEPEQNRVAFRRPDAPSPATGQAKTRRGATHSSTYTEAAAPVVVHDSSPPASGPHDKVRGASLASLDISDFQAALDRRLDESGGRLSLAGNIALEELLLKTDNDGNAILHLLAGHGRIDIMDELLDRVDFHDKAKFDFAAPMKLRQQLVEACTSSGFNALHIATQFRHIPAVHRLCHWGGDCYTPIVNSTTFNKQQETALHLACRKHDADMVVELLKLGADVEALDGNQRGPILVAAEEGSVEIFRLLVKHKASLLARGQSSPLHVAAEVGNIQLVDEILSLGADQKIVHSKLVAQQDNLGRTPAMLAAQFGHEAVFHRLYKYSCKWEVGKAKNGWGILHFAAKGGKIGILKTILKSGGRISTPGTADMDGDNPLQIAASMGHDKAVQLLLESGAWSESIAISALPSAGTEDIAQRLLLTLTELHHRNLDPDILLRALTNAAKMGLKVMVRSLLETYPQIPTSATLDSSPLIEAARAGHLDIVRRLIKHEPPADVNLPDGQGRTALLCAAENGHIRVVNYLHRLRATSRDSLDATGRTALVAAAVQGHLDVVMTLASRSFWTTQLVDSALCAAAEAGQVDVVGLLLPIADPFAQRPSLLDATNIRTFTALEHAARQGHADVIRVCLNFMGTICDGSLLEAVAHPACIAELIESGLFRPHQIDMRDCNGRTTLSLAVEHGYYESARLLLKHKANPLAADINGKTPLHHAAVVSRPPGSGHKPLFKGELVELLLQYLGDDAPTYVRDIKGITPLLAAVAAGAVYSVRALLGCDDAGGHRRQDGHSAFWMAVESGNIEIVLLMVEILGPRWMGTETLKELVTVAARRNTDMQILLLCHGHKGFFCLKNPPDWVTDLVSNDCTGRVVRFLLDHKVEDAVLAREDEHGWRLMDFAYATDMALAWRKTDTEVSRMANQWFRLPTKFETVPGLGEAYTELREGGNLVRSCVTPEMLRYPVTVRADHPIPPLRAFYFEVTIVDEGDDYKQNSIGLATKDTTIVDIGDPSRVQRRNQSYFYVGGGNVTMSGEIMGSGREFRTGDVIGCHVDLSRGFMYFRKNGRRIGLGQRPEVLGVWGRLFPMFYSRSRGVEVRVNFAAGLGNGVQYEREGTRECV